MGLARHRAKREKAEAAKRQPIEHAAHAGRDDVHEQREPDQPREGVVRKPVEAKRRPKSTSKR